MKRVLFFLLAVALTTSFSLSAFAADSNVDGGGGGMGSGTNSNSWTPGRDGVRVTIVRDSDNTPVSDSIDFSNAGNGDIKIHFQYKNKLDYKSGSSLNPKQGGYSAIKPRTAMPRIISSNGASNISAIRSYFTDKGTIHFVAEQANFTYNDLISGKYKILLEPIAYFKFNSIMFAMTATEAAMYNQKTSNSLRHKMVSLTHKNLPLSMFLETTDLGFPAWDAATNAAQNDGTIIANVGLGIIRFSEPDPEPTKESTVTYRCDTEVITAVTLTTGEKKTPKNSAYAQFSINGTIYSHNNIYIPEDGSQLAWIKWRTPKDPGVITITVTSTSLLK